MALKISRVLLMLMFLFSGAVFGSVDDYQNAVQRDSNSVVSRFNLGLAYYQEQQYDNAAESLKKTLEMNREDKASHKKVDFQAAQLLGIIYFNFKNSTDEAITYFKKAAELNPSEGNNNYYLGLAFKKNGNADDALKAFLKALENGADDAAEVNFRIGQIYYEKKDYKSSMGYFEKVAGRKPDFAEAREYLGDIYDRRGEADKAVENYIRVVKVNPNNMHAQFQLGLNYSKQKEYDKMIAAYKKTIDIDPNFSDAHYNLGMAYYYRNMYEDAIAEFQTAIKLSPNDAAAYSLLAQTKTTAYDFHISKGSAFLTGDDFLQARDELQKALAVKPGDPEARKYLDITNESIRKAIPAKLEQAKSDFENKKYSEAYNGWDFVMKADPENAQAREGMAGLERNSGDIVTARELKAADLEKQGRLAEAITEYSEISKIAPKSRQAGVSAKISALMSKIKGKVKLLLAAADEANAAKESRKALEKYNEVLKYDEKNGRALNGITKIKSNLEDQKQIYLAMAKQNKADDRTKSLTYYKKAIELDPNSEEANKGIEQLTGSQSKVALDAQKIKSMYYEGVDKYVNGEVDTAIKIWKQVLAMDPSHVEARKNIKRAEEKLQAIKSLSR
jgi:tetratricopeptide (TPR) repeat protein